MKIVEAPAVYRSGQMSNSYQPARHVSQSETKLVTRVKPSAVSGPPHLQVLAGKCFTLVHDGYKYEFCPYHNVTQKEQTVRWNAFSGVLGVWKEWVIVNNTFEAMLLANGDLCPGEKPRQTKVFLRCGDQNKVISVVEPTICHYDLRFETPLACPIDAFLVYPVLSAEGQKEWEEIEEALYRKELTLQGYNKYRRALFQKENLIPNDSNKKKPKIEESVENTSSEGDLNSQAGDNRRGKISSFNSKEECSKAYSSLLAEVQKLTRKLLNMSCSGCNNSIMDTHINKPEQSNVDLENRTGGISSNTERPVKENLNVQEPLRGDQDQLKEQKITLKTKDDKGFQSLVENLRGDLGLKRNQSTEGKQRKSDMFMNANES